MKWDRFRILFRITRLEEQMSELDDITTELQQDDTNLAADATAVQAQIANLQAQIAGLPGAPTQGQIDALKQAADNLAATHAAFVNVVSPPAPPTP